MDVTKKSKTHTDKYSLKNLLLENDIYYASIAHSNQNYVLKPLDIVNDDMILKEMSAEDIKTLCYYAFLDKNSPKYKILTSIADITKKHAIKLISSTGEIIEEKLENFLSNKVSLNNISSYDAYRLGVTLNSDIIKF